MISVMSIFKKKYYNRDHYNNYVYFSFAAYSKFFIIMVINIIMSIMSIIIIIRRIRIRVRYMLRTIISMGCSKCIIVISLTSGISIISRITSFITIVIIIFFYYDYKYCFFLRWL